MYQQRDWEEYRDGQITSSDRDHVIYEYAIFWNLGVQCQASDALLLRLDGYNLLGFFDKDISKERQLAETWRSGEYKIQSPALGASIVYRFK